MWINSLPFFQLLAQEYNTERFKIAAATNESLKRQMGLVEDRNRQLDRISAQHEASFTGRSCSRTTRGRARPSWRPTGCGWRTPISPPCRLLNMKKMAKECF